MHKFHKNFKSDKLEIILTFYITIYSYIYTQIYLVIF